MSQLSFEKRGKEVSAPSMYNDVRVSYKKQKKTPTSRCFCPLDHSPLTPFFLMSNWDQGEVTSTASHNLPPLPPPSEEVQDGSISSDQIKLLTTFRYNEKGEVEKVVRRIRTVTLSVLKHPALLEREKGIAKFGLAASKKDTTVISNEDIFIDPPGVASEKDGIQILKDAASGGVREKLLILFLYRNAAPPSPPLIYASELSLFNYISPHNISHLSTYSLISLAQSIVTCRKCGGKHWTNMCPYKSIAAMQPGILPTDTGSSAEPSGSVALASVSSSALASAGGAYKPPSLRTGSLASSDLRVQTDEEKVQLKVSNIDPETTEDDLRAIFQRYGNLDPKFRIQRDAKGNSRSFCFLRYKMHREAAAALDGVNGLRLGHMVLKVEFTESRDRFSNSSSGAHRHLSGYGSKLADTTGATLLSR